MLFCLRIRVWPPPTRRGTPRNDLKSSTDIGIVDMTECTDGEVNEACLVQGNKFVASTAKFAPGWDAIIPIRPDLCPEKYVI